MSNPKNIEARLRRSMRRSRHPTQCSERVVSLFQSLVYIHYRRCRRNLPWRGTRDPYRVLVSEIMLQQTRVETVLRRYTAFLRRFPDVASLAAAPLEEILRRWQGLGYNRRALALKGAASHVVTDFGGRVPADETLLRKLPGVGPATASAVLAFAFNKPSILIETNIRRVFLHVFFREHACVSDREILPLIERTMDRRAPRRWYWALMDYGALLGRNGENPNRKSAHYWRQEPFEGSDRQIRGMILRTLLARRTATAAQIAAQADLRAPERVEKNLRALQREGLVTRDGRSYRVTR